MKSTATLPRGCGFDHTCHTGKLSLVKCVPAVKQYQAKKIDNNLYQLETINWKISGVLNTTIVNGIIIEGVIEQNIKEIEIKSHGDFIKVSNKIIELETEKTNLSEKKSENKKDLDELKTKIIGIKVNISENKKDVSVLEEQIKDFTLKKTKVQSNLVGLERAPPDGTF